MSLISRASVGDPAAFETLLSPSVEDGYKLAFAILHDRQEAEDAVQEAAIKAWRNLPMVRGGPGAARPWFLKIVLNQCRSMKRGRWWSVIRQSDVVAIRDVDEDRVVDAIDARVAISRMPSGQRLVLFLHYYLDLPLDEVARVLGISRGGAKSRLHRAIESLKQQIRPEEARL